MDKIPIFLSRAVPHNKEQEEYVKALIRLLVKTKFKVVIVGGNTYSIQKPLIPVQEKMREVSGAVILCLERFHCQTGIFKEGSENEKKIENYLFPSVWMQIEAAMAYQMRLPLLVLKEEKLYGEGMFDPAVIDWNIININSKKPEELRVDPIRGFFNDWADKVVSNYQKNVK